MAGEYLSVEDVATALGIHRKTVERYIREGKLRASNWARCTASSARDLDAWLGEKAPTSPCAAAR